MKHVSTLLFLTIFCLSIHAEAAQNWSGPESVSQDHLYWSGANVAMDAEGNAISLFASYSKKGKKFEIWVEACSKLVNGTWSVPVAITPKAVDTRDRVGVYPVISIDQEGNAVAIWNFPDGDNEIIQSGRLPFGSSEWIVETLSTGVECQAGPFLRLDQQGQALASWGIYKEGKYYIESARLSSGKADWNMLTPLEIPNTFQGLSMHVNAAGVAWLIWLKGGFLEGQNVTVSTLTSKASTWSKPMTLGEENGITYGCPQIASDLQGNVLAIWQEYDETDRFFVSYQRPQGSQTWKKTVLQKVATDIYACGWLSMDPQGNALFVWRRDISVLMNSQLAKGQSNWTKPQVITSDEILNWTGSTDSKGNRLLSWIKWDENTLKSATLPAGEKAWTTPVSHTIVNQYLEDCQLSDNGSAILLYSDGQPSTLKAVSGQAF
ncbi:MAG: hypothetical protein LLG04_02530 [Parachlamydia sp.]|nr:hypothetical protein [Parachlamydia sp.]